jgi:hypothetical protein
VPPRWLIDLRRTSTGGPVRRVSYAGCHRLGDPRTAGDRPGALALLEQLLGPTHRRDAAGGSIMRTAPASPPWYPDAVDARRLEITRQTIDEAMITYPPLARFPEIEDAGWAAIRSAVQGTTSPLEAAHAIQVAAEGVLA